MPLIVLEGIDGCGKTTQIDLLKSEFPEALFLREPGGTTCGEQLRAILLNPENNLASKTELLIFLAARAQIFAEKIKPALRDKKIVILDRFVYSTIAYQIVGLDMPKKGLWIDILRLIIEDCEPDFLFWLDLPLQEAIARRAGQSNDKIEERSVNYFERVFDTYQEQMQLTGIKINASNKPEQVHSAIMQHLRTLKG